MVRVKPSPTKGRRHDLQMVKTEDSKEAVDMSFLTFTKGILTTSTPKRVEKIKVELKTDNEKPKTIKTKKDKHRKKKSGSKSVIIPNVNFTRLVKEISKEMGNDIRWKKNSVMALQTVAEEVIVDLFDRARFIAEENSRTTVMLKDFRSALYKFF